MTWVRRAFFALVVLYLVLPLIVILGVSLNAQRVLFFPPRGLSLRWYREFFTSAEWLTPTMNSLTIATFASLIAITVALPIAFAAWRHRTRTARVLLVMGFAPFALPPVITALGALALWILVGSYGQPFTVTFSHGVFLMTLPLATITFGLLTINPQTLEAAVTMGANGWAVFRTVIVPFIRPYVIAGLMFAFVLSLNEYIIAYMTVGFTVETLPIKIFNSLRYGYTPVMASVSLLFFLLAVAVFGAIGALGNLPKLLGADPRKD